MRSRIRLACKTGGKCAEMPTSPQLHLFSSLNLEPWMCPNPTEFLCVFHHLRAHAPQTFMASLHSSQPTHVAPGYV